MELVTINNDKVPVTTSKKVAEYFGKRHGHVLDAVRTIQETLGDQGLNTEPSFRSSEYSDSTGRTLPMFEMDRKGFMLLVMGFTGDKAMKFKSDFVDAFDAMEAELTRRQDTLPDLNNPQFLRGLLLDYTEKVQELEMKVEEDAPKVEAYDDFLGLEGLHTLTIGLKSIGLKPNLTMEWMRGMDYLYMNKGRNIARQRYVNSGLFVVKPVRAESGYIFMQTLLTQKGLDYFSKKKREGHIPVHFISKIEEPIEL